MSPRRLDLELVSRGLASSRTQAKSLVVGGAVQVDGATVTRAAYPVEEGQQVKVSGQAAGEAAWITDGWVGRGALKLEHAFAVWGAAGLDVSGRRCLDIGASTGGFTQVLLSRGAAQVLALDVGHDQLDPRVGGRAEVVDLSGTTVRGLTAETLGGRVEAVVCDVSFISLRHVLPVLPEVCEPGADVVLLVKPQFEVGPTGLGRGGIVRSAQARAAALREVIAAATDLGLRVGGVERSPLTGGNGNIEYLLWLRTAAPGSSTVSGMMDWGLPQETLAARCDVLRAEEET